MTKSRIDEALEQHADSSAVAAVELSRRQLKRRRDKAKADAAKAGAQARDEAAGVVSRARGVVGPTSPGWYAPAVLEWLRTDDPCPARIEAEFQRLVAEQGRYAEAGEPDRWTPAWRAEWDAGVFADVEGVPVDLNDADDVEACRLRRDARLGRGTDYLNLQPDDRRNT